MNYGFLGCGRMATALASGMLKGRKPGSRIFVYDRVPVAMEALVENVAAIPMASAAQLASRADVLLLCVKPKDAPDALRELADALDDIMSDLYDNL